jgi:hypothetical protein
VARPTARRWVAWCAALWVVVALGASASAAEATSTPTAWASAALLGQRAEPPAARTDVEPAAGCACQDDRARTRKLGGAASAAMALAGLILAVRRYRQRNRLPREDRKFGSYRGPKP